MSTPNDITEELRRDREKGAKRLVDEYKDSLLLFALKLCDDNYYSAEALVYQTFFDVLAKIEEYDAAKGDFTGWMRGMMKRCHAKNSRRKSDKTVVLAKDIPEVPDDGAEYVYKSVDSAILRDAICAMPKEMKDVVVLHYFMDAPIAQMARTLAIPVGTVKSRLHYAKLALRKRLGATVKKHITALVFAGIALFSTAAVLVSSAIATGEATSLSGEEVRGKREEVRGKREEVRGKREEGRGAVATSAPLPYDSNEMISSEKQTTQGGNTMNMKNATAALAAVAMTAAAPLPAAAGTVTLDGKIEITYDGSGSSAAVSTPGGASETIAGKVTGIVATPADGETLTLTGDALTFSDGAAITMAADGNLVIENNVTIAQTLSLARSDGAYQVWNNTAVANIDANTEPVVIPGAGLYSLRDDKWQIVSICAGVSHSASCYGRYDAVVDLEFAEVTPSGGNNYWHCIFPANRWDGLNTWSARLQLYQYNDSPDVRLDIKAFGHGLDYSYEPTADLYDSRYPTASPTNYVGVGTALMGLDHVVLRKSTASPASIGFKGRLTVQSSYNIDVAAGVELAILSGNGTTVNMPKLSGDGNVRFARDVGLVVDCMMKDSIWNITNSLVQTAGAITNMIPTNALVNIWDGGVFYPRTQGLNTGDGLSAGRADFKVHSGGELRFYSGDGKLSPTQHLENDGGLVWMGYPYSVSAFAGSGDSVSDGVMGMFLNRITLSNGAVVKGRKIRIGNNNDALWRVSGSLPSYFNSHAHFYGYGGKPWVFYVENATGDDDIDFYFNGYITNHVGASYRTSAIIKKGAGTMRIGGTVETHKPLEIREGALVMGENGGPAEASTVKSVVVGAGATLEIEGGEMSFGDIVLGDGATLKIDGGAMAFGILTMTNATIELGSGATVAFADSSASEWSGTLTVKGYSRYGAVRFGTSADGLTAEQLSAISLEGGAALKIIYDGSLVPDNISNMPSGVPYIESDGTQYINLGYNVGPNTTVRFDFAMAETDHNVRPFGARGDQRCGLGYSGGMYFSFFFDNQTKKSDIIQDRNCHTAFFDFASGKCGIDSWSDLFTPASGETSQQPLFVFAEAVNNDHTYIYSPAEANENGYYLPAKAKVYGVKIFESGEEVRNFVPCLKRGYLLTPNASNETCVAGLKETHTGYFHTSENLLRHPLAYGGDILTENDDAYVSSERNVLAQGVETNMLIDTAWKFVEGERVDLDFALLTPDTDGANPFPAGIEPTVISGVQTNAGNTTTEILRVGAFSDGSHTNFQFVLGGGSQNYPKYPVATAYGVRRTLSFTHNKIRVITAGYTNIDWTSSSPFSEGSGMLKIGAQGLRYVSERSGQTLNSATNFAPMKIYGFRVYNASNELQSEYIPSVANGVPGLKCERKGGFWKARSLTQPQYLNLNPTDEDKAKDYPERYSDTVINTAGYTNMVFSIYGETNQVLHAESDRDAYLEFDGENGHCINTGYVVTPNTRIEMDLSLWFTGHRDNKRQQFFLSQAPAGGETGIWFRFFLRGTGYYAYKYRDNDDNQGGWQDIGGANGGGYPVTPARRRFVFDGFQNKVQMLAMDGGAPLHDGELNNVPRTATECSDGSTLWVASNGRMLEHGACMKLYGLKLYESGVLQREYVPYRNGDERGLYDIVEGTKLPLTNNVGAAVGRVSGGDWRRGDGERVILLTVGRRHEQILKCVAAGQIGEYRWYRNGELMPGQTGDTLTVSCEEPGTRTVYTVVPRYEIFGVEYEDGVPATAVVESYKSGMVSIFR